MDCTETRNARVRLRRGGTTLCAPPKRPQDRLASPLGLLIPGSPRARCLATVVVVLPTYHGSRSSPRWCLSLLIRWWSEAASTRALTAAATTTLKATVARHLVWCLARLLRLVVRARATRPTLRPRRPGARRSLLPSPPWLLLRPSLPLPSPSPPHRSRRSRRRPPAPPAHSPPLPTGPLLRGRPVPVPSRRGRCSPPARALPLRQPRPSTPRVEMAPRGCLGSCDRSSGRRRRLRRGPKRRR